MKKRFLLLFLFWSFVIYYFWFFVPSNFTFLEKIEVNAVNTFFNDKIINHSSFYGNYTYALEFKKENNYYQFIVDRDCLGLNMFTAILIFVLSYPPSLKFLFYRALFLGISFFLIELLNVIRLVVLYFLFKNYFEIYDFFHDFIWQISNILVVFFFIFLYLKLLKFVKLKKHENNKGSSL